MLQHLSGGQWGMVGRASSRPQPDAAAVALLFIPILFGMPPLFLWARPEAVAGDQILQMKAPYLNVNFFIDPRGHLLRVLALLRVCC